MHQKFIYQCTNCGSEYNNSQIRYLCPKCEKENTADLPPKGVLKVIYNYAELKKKYKLSDFKQLENNRLTLLPIQSLRSLPKLKTGNTPVYEFSELSLNKTVKLFFKDESRNPTFSFKDRASEMVSAFAKEHGIETIITASTGNAGSSLAGICASQQQKAIVLLPENAPKAKLIQAIMYGATLLAIKGNYDNAFDFSIKASHDLGLYNRNTAYNPITIEGKKTVAFEMFINFKGVLPNYIFVPVGDGVIISGIYKGFEDLLLLGLINEIPQIIGVQAQTSANLANNIGQEPPHFPPTNTIADSIQVDVPRNFYLTRQYLQKYNGTMVQVNDTEILDASKQLSTKTGLFAEPASAAAFAGFLKLQQNNTFKSDTKVLVLITGCGLKDINAYIPLTQLIKPIDNPIPVIKKLLEL